MHLDFNDKIIDFVYVYSILYNRIGEDYINKPKLRRRGGAVSMSTA